MRTHCDKILVALESGEWISALTLVAIALNYRRRISDLRVRGYVIQNELRRVNGSNHSYYRLIGP